MESWWLSSGLWFEGILGNSIPVGDSFEKAIVEQRAVKIKDRKANNTYVQYNSWFAFIKRPAE